MHTLSILPAQEFARLDLAVPPRFRLCFPRRWRAEPVLNVHAAAIERETIAWLRAHGIGCSAEEAGTVAKYDCAGYGGYSVPLAEPDAAVLVTQFIALWLFWDDAQVEAELGWDIDEVVEALQGARPRPGASRYVAAWADLGRRLGARRSAAWLDRLTRAMRQWLANAKLETAMAQQLRRSGTGPDFATLLACRTTSIGMLPVLHLVEHAASCELGDAVHAHADVVELGRLAARLVGMGNDLGGLARDLRDRWLNLVGALAQDEGLPLADAFARVVALHNAEVATFDRVAAGLPSWGAGTDALVRRWVQAIRHNIHGFALWESLAPRYQEYRAVAGGEPLIAAVTTFDDAPAGRERSAA